MGPRASKTTADLVSTNVGIISFVWLWISHARMLVDKNLRQVLRFIMLFVYYVVYFFFTLTFHVKRAAAAC